MLQDLLSKYSTAAEKEQYLLQLVKEHPYFTPAQFCLLQNTPVQDDAYRQRAATTALLFNNTGWLNYQLNNQFKEAAAEFPQASQPMAVEAVVPPEEQPTTGSAEPETAPQLTAVIAEVTAEAPGTITAPLHKTGDEVQEDATEETAADACTEKAAGQLAIPGPGKQEGELLFEPLFATDYFASQGIKLSEEVLKGDKLGKQLKSFTEWLKSMKKTHPQEAGETNDAAGNIPYIAEKSNEDGNVVTEAMAEVYALQGNTKKAIAIYQKLSLLNPPKSAYFAAKIENLK
jgi:hypothetical protein